ncbi:MAG: C40 family peptidase [Steroidobacteraceae bacterium]|nr:C40 family peptidase [Steroidobacteraceae bacterium]MDW8259659.1 C40 family peptidase [Gammaproteobacteria bacterium]
MKACRTAPLALLAAAGTMLAGCSLLRSPPAERPAPPVDDAVSVPAPTAGERIAALAAQQLGAPYRRGGATPAGFDCSGLVRYVYALLGTEIPRTAREQQLAAVPVELDSLQPGDLLFFRIDGPLVDHVAIYVGNDEFVHAPRAGRAVSRDSLSEPFFRQRLSHAGRLWR